MIRIPAPGLWRLTLGLLAFGAAGGLPASAAAAATPPRKVKVFLLAGQSNMEGKGDGSLLTADERTRLNAIQRRVRIAYNHEPIDPRPAALVLFNPAMAETVLDEIGRGGPEQAAFNARIMSLPTPRDDEPPALFLYGERDAAYLARAREFAATATTKGRRCEVWVAGGVGHGFFNRQPWHDAALRQADQFLVKLGFLSGTPAIAEQAEAKMNGVASN